MNPISAVLLMTATVCFIVISINYIPRRFKVRLKACVRIARLIMRNEPYVALFLDIKCGEYEIHSNLNDDGLLLVQKTFHSHIEQERALKQTNEIIKQNV